MAIPGPNNVVSPLLAPLRLMSSEISTKASPSLGSSSHSHEDSGGRSSKCIIRLTRVQGLESSFSFDCTARCRRIDCHCQGVIVNGGVGEEGRIDICVRHRISTILTIVAVSCGCQHDDDDDDVSELVT